MRIVVAIGGNAFLTRGETPDAAAQERRVHIAVRALAPLAARHELVITHGNGPQIGVLAVESAADAHLSAPFPFDVLGAQTQGMIGYWLLQALKNELPNRLVAAIISQTLVDADDAAFADPTKFIGETYDAATAQRLAAANNWTVKPDGDRWRRVIASPEPRRLLDTKLLLVLLAHRAVVVCAGGGGVPVVRNHLGLLEGVEAVVDKDLTAAVLAEAVEADALLILTDVAGVFRRFGAPDAELVDSATPASLRGLTLPAGSMGPKVEAACRFVEHTGGLAGIGRLEDAAAILGGAAGTLVWMPHTS
jgi:carbamate kinase